MFSNVSKIVISLSLLTAVSAMAAPGETRDADLSNQDSSTAVHSGETTRTMKAQGSEQAKDLSNTDSNSSAARAAARLAGGAKVKFTDLQLRIKAQASAMADAISDINVRKAILEKVAYVASIDPARGEIALKKIVDGAAAVHNLAGVAKAKAIQLVTDVANVEKANANDGRQNLEVANAQDPINTYIADVEKEAISKGNRASFKAADNEIKILEEYYAIHDTQKKIELSKTPATPMADLDRAIMQQAAYNVIASFHNKGDKATYMSEADMRELAKEIVAEKKCT